MSWCTICANVSAHEEAGRHKLAISQDMKNTFGEPIANYFLKTNKNTTTTYDCLDLYAKNKQLYVWTVPNVYSNKWAYPFLAIFSVTRLKPKCHNTMARNTRADIPLTNHRATTLKVCFSNKSGEILICNPSFSRSLDIPLRAVVDSSRVPP